MMLFAAMLNAFVLIQPWSTQAWWHAPIDGCIAAATVYGIVMAIRQ